MISLFLSLLPSQTPSMALALGNSWLLFYLLSSSPPLPPRSFLTLFCTLSSLCLSYFPIFFSYTLSFSLPFLSLGHIHLRIVMIAARSSAMACRKSELVHVSEHRYALWTPAGSFTDCWSEEGHACMHGLQNKAPKQPQGKDAAKYMQQHGMWRRIVKCPKNYFSFAFLMRRIYFCYVKYDADKLQSRVRCLKSISWY